PDPAGWFTLGEPAIEPLAALECILMRKDPPFDTEYIYSTYILERAESAGVLIVNRPQGLRDMNEKVYTAWFPQCCAPTLITRAPAYLRRRIIGATSPPARPGSPARSTIATAGSRARSARRSPRKACCSSGST